MALTTISPTSQDIFVVHAKVIFLDQFLRPPGSHPEAPVRRCFEPCNSNRLAVPLAGRLDGSTDPVAFAGGGAVTACQVCLNLTGLDKLISRINANRESVSPGQAERLTPGIRIGSCQEI
jgi:hypothetical protein